MCRDVDCACDSAEGSHLQAISIEHISSGVGVGKHLRIALTW